MTQSVATEHAPDLDVSTFTDEDFEKADGIDDFLDRIAIRNPWKISVRHLTMLSGNYRRGSRVKHFIARQLADRGLVSRPPFERAGYWGEVLIIDPRDLALRPSATVALPISSLRGDSASLDYVKAEDSIDTAETKMVLNDFSQLPVLASQRRELKGSIDWRSIAASRIHGSPKSVRDAMTPGGHVAESSDSLMDLVPTILRNEYIFYRNGEREIVGIVTATDLAATFQDTTGVFIRISEIEDRIRELLDKISLPRLQQALDPNIDRGGSDFAGASDMTFGEYVRALEDKDIWGSLELRYNRAICVDNLRTVNKVRNDIMHFRMDSTGDDPDPNIAVSQCLNWLRSC